MAVIAAGSAGSGTASQPWQPGPIGSAPGVMKSRIDIASMELDLTPHVPEDTLNKYVLFIYGEKKIGKTSLALMFPKTFFIFTEAGGKGAQYVGRVTTMWEEIVKLGELLVPNTDIETIVIDTVDNAYEFCLQYVCWREGFTHPGLQNDFGASWKKVSDEFIKFLNLMTLSGKGVILLSHAREAEIRTRNMGDRTRIVPTLAGKPADYLAGAADLNGYYGFYGTERRLVIDGSEVIEAGCRNMGDHMRTVDGRKIVSIPMGDNEHDAYENLIAAFNNQFEDTYDDVHKLRPTLVSEHASLKPKSLRR